MTDAELLSLTEPEDLFPGDLASAKVAYRALLRRWHPDRDDGDQAVTAHVNALYREAVRRIEGGTWARAGVLRVQARTGEAWQLEYLASRPFELGRMYVGNTHLTYLVGKDHGELFENAAAFTGIFSFANCSMRDEMAEVLPRDVQRMQLSDGRLLMRVPKEPDLLCLCHVLDHLGGKLDPRHVAWIGSGMHNLACYLRWAGLVHMNVSPDSVFISPRLHRVALIGGWWFAAKEGRRIGAIPARTHAFLPWAVRSSKVATWIIDLELVRATARELLGDVDGTRLLDPEPLARWLRLPAEGEPSDVYRQWHEVLRETFGPRKFVELKLDTGEVYQPRRR